MTEPEELPLTRDELETVLLSMKIPRMRRDIRKLDNLLWLSRNLGIQNRDHHQLPAARLLVRALIQNERKLHEHRHSDQASGSKD